MIDFTKLLELYISRKDKFKKAEERLKRREVFFEEILAIEKNTNLSWNQKRVMKDSAAQKLTGNGLATYEFVDYYCRHPDFINFEIISPMVAFWDQTLIKTYDDEKKIIKLEFNTIVYWKEKIFSFLSCALLFFAIFFFGNYGNTIINFISSNFYISSEVIGIAYLAFILVLVGIFFFFTFLFLTLLDLKRLVK
ncbi:hypothetical protein [Acinetobacter radioresistens]|uniref:hypothetical protein n=1 Tax=Acinetobacter radioresistens TaxID=40216 RepID=UPI002003D7AF|nr:hypothetical protein [Acinetobacter radioresistens]MCK4107915.1 hypothetical protein [Acinetobacter radioresistens]